MLTFVGNDNVWAEHYDGLPTIQKKHDIDARQRREQTQFTSWWQSLQYNIIYVYIESFWPLAIFASRSSAHSLLVFCFLVVLLRRVYLYQVRGWDLSPSGTCCVVG